MAQAPHTIEEITWHEKTYGHPAGAPPVSVREAAAREGYQIPVVPVLLGGLVCPPLPHARTPEEAEAGKRPGGHCHVCGVVTRDDENLAAHAVAGFEQATAQDGQPIRLLVTHCAEHADRQASHCRRDLVTAGSGYEGNNPNNVPGGFCEPLDKVVQTSIAFIPGAPQLGRFIRFGLRSMGLLVPAYLLSQLAVNRSQGQMVADFTGPVTSLVVPGDATSGHGYNAGGLRILSGAAPSTAPAANQAETGTLLIAWAMPATAFTAAFSSNQEQATAGAISNVNASATGTAGYGRMVEVADTFGLSTSFRRYQFAVGTSGSDMNFNTLAISSGGACSVTSLVVAISA